VALRKRALDHPVLERFDTVAQVLTGNRHAKAQDAVEWLTRLVSDLGISGLSSYGLKASDIDSLVEKAKNSSSMKGNPIVLEHDELVRIVQQAM
jgi:alcohol dehydrogenase class IV